MIELELCGRQLRYQPLTATTPDGVVLSILDHIPPEPLPDGARDILFIHGFSQSSLSWLKQTTGPLRYHHRLVTYDVRGHGSSDKPLEPEYYRDSRRWADEVETVISAAGLDRPVIVCWSYSGRIALDYLSHHGDNAISGLVMIAATSTVKDGVLGPATPSLRQIATAPDCAANLAATRDFLGLCTTAPLPADEFALMLGFNLMVPVAVRSAMSGRPADYDDVLAAIEVPVLAIHGEGDPINTPAMSEYTVAHCRNTRLSLFPATGHLPFWEQPARFDAELGAFLNMLD